MSPMDCTARHISKRMALFCLFGISSLLASGTMAHGLENSQEVVVKINWGKVLRISKTNATLAVAPSPLLRRDSPIYHRAFHSLRDLKCDFVRYVPWYPF